MEYAKTAIYGGNASELINLLKSKQLSVREYDSRRRSLLTIAIFTHQLDIVKALTQVSDILHEKDILFLLEEKRVK